MIDWIVSLASLLVSIVAIVISIQQTRLSNKQQLFEKRAAKYVEISELLNNYWNIQDSLNQKMILKSSTRVIDCLLSPVRATSEDKLSTIIDLCHRLKQSAVEISLLWKDKKCAPEAADKMKLTAEDVVAAQAAERMIKEPEKLTTQNMGSVFEQLREELRRFLKQYAVLEPEKLCHRPYERFRKL